MGAAADLQGAASAWATAARNSGRPNPTSSWSSSIRAPGSGCWSTPSAAATPSPSRSTSTWSSPQEGGEGPTPYEVLLHAAMIGDSTRFTRQDNIEETWRIMAPLIDKPPRVHPVQARLLGPEGRGPAGGRLRRLARAVDRRHEPAKQKSAEEDPLQRKGGGERGRTKRPRPASEKRNAAERRGARRRSRRSPTTRSSPTATPGRSGRARRRGRLALRAALRLAERLRHPARPQAGNFRLGPFGINVPNARVYEPGTNTLLTTWHTPTGWVMVRDALTMGPATHEDEVTPHTRPPTDEDGDHMLVRTVLCLERDRGGRADLRARLRLRADARRVVADRPPHRRRDWRRARRSASRATWRWAWRATGCAPATT